jgi:hypothetical protein
VALSDQSKLRHWHDEALWGDLDDELPELTFSTLGNARTQLESLMSEGEEWWTLNIDSLDVFDDFDSAMRKAKIKTYGQIKDDIDKILENINKSIPRSLQNCIIAGTKRALIDKELIAKSLDDDEIIGDNRTVAYVRQELLQ